MQTLGVSEDTALTQNTTAEICGSITIPEGISGRLYVFVWKNDSSLQPLCERIKVF